MVWMVLIGAQVCFPLIFGFLFNGRRLNPAPRWRLRRVLGTMGSWSRNSVWLVTFSFWTARERLRCAGFGKLRVVSARARRVLAQVSLLLDVPHCIGESVTFRLVRFQVLSLVVVDMIVMSGSRQYELLLSLGRRGILLPSRAPSRYLRTLCGSVLCLNRVLKFIVTRAWAIHFLGTQVRLSTESRFKSATICLCSRWTSFIVEARAKLITWARRLKLPVVHARTWPILDL